MAENGVSARQERAILALLSEPTVRDAAKVAKIGERTLQRWLSEPVFQEAFKQARHQAVAQATARLQKASTEAVTVLVDVMNSIETPPASRIAAARTILEHMRTSADTEELEERIRALELALEQEETSE